MKKPPHPNPVKQSDADAFALFVHRWQDRLNLNDWRIVRSSKPAAKSNLAEVVRRDLGARLATYRIGEDFGSLPVTEQSVEEIACHEVLHIFLYELIEFARENSQDLPSVEHRVINTLVRLLVPQTE